MKALSFRPWSQRPIHPAYLEPGLGQRVQDRVLRGGRGEVREAQRLRGLEPIEDEVGRVVSATNRCCFECAPAGIWHSQTSVGRGYAIVIMQCNERDRPVFTTVASQEIVTIPD